MKPGLILSAGVWSAYGLRLLAAGADHGMRRPALLLSGRSQQLAGALPADQTGPVSEEPSLEFGFRMGRCPGRTVRCGPAEERYPRITVLV